jgi:4-hydroxy 2-oxovalerate aldolase
MQLFDCTLRDGANIVGKGFSKDLTILIIEGLIASNIKVIEMGNSGGIGGHINSKQISPVSDLEYMEIIQPYLDAADIGMFISVTNCNE